MPPSPRRNLPRLMRWLVPLAMIVVGLAATAWTKQLSYAVLFTVIGGATLGLMACFLFEALAVLLGDVTVGDVTVLEVLDDDGDTTPEEKPGE